MLWTSWFFCHCYNILPNISGLTRPTSFSTHSVLQNIIGNNLELHDLKEMSLWPGDSSKTFQTDLNILDKFYHEAPPCALNTLPRLCRQQLPMFTNSGYFYSSWLLWRNLRSFQFILNQSMEWWAILDTFNCFMPSSNESHKFFAFDYFRNYNCST